MTIIKKEREGAATLLYSMQIIIIVNITYYKTITYNGLIIGKLTLITKKKERVGAGTLIYSMQLY